MRRPGRGPRPATLLLGAITVRAVAEQSTQLAEDLATPQPAGRTRILMADGTYLAWLYDLNRQPVALDQVSPWMVKAQLAVENHRFYDQGPIDPMGIARATLGNITTDGQAGGGSGITQQYVKMLLVEQAHSSLGMMPPVEFEQAHYATLHREPQPV